jgi:hypothetical protein
MLIWRPNQIIERDKIDHSKLNFVSGTILSDRKGTATCRAERSQNEDILAHKAFEDSFSCIYTDEKDYLPLCPVRPNHKQDSVILPEALVFPWKTELFKGKLENVALLDLILLDEKRKPMWTFSSPIVFRKMGMDFRLHCCSMGLS